MECRWRLLSHSTISNLFSFYLHRSPDLLGVVIEGVMSRRLATVLGGTHQFEG